MKRLASWAQGENEICNHTSQDLFPGCTLNMFQHLISFTLGPLGSRFPGKADSDT